MNFTTSLNFNDAEASLSSKNFLLRTYAWFSMIIVVLVPITNIIIKIHKHGFKATFTKLSVNGINQTISKSSLFIVLFILIIYLVLWVRANIILLNTNDQNRANNILNWLSVISFIQVLMAMFPQINWLSLIVFITLFLATLFMRFKMSNPNELKFYQLESLDLKQKVFMSAPFTFIFYTVPFGIFQGFSNGSHKHPFNMYGGLFGGLFFGFFMTVFSRRQFKKTGLATGFSDPKKQRTIYKAIRTADLPKDPEIIAALPSYIDKRIESSKKSSKSSIGLMALLGIASLVGAIAEHSILFAALSVLFFILTPLSYRAVKLNERRLAELKSKLDLLN